MRRCRATWEVVGMEGGVMSPAEMTESYPGPWWLAGDMSDQQMTHLTGRGKCDVCVLDGDILWGMCFWSFETQSRKRKSDRASQGAGVLPLRLWTRVKNVSLSCCRWSIPEGETGHALLLCSIFVACVFCNLWPHPYRDSVILIAISVL